MGQQYEVDGVLYEFPEGFTDDDAVRVLRDQGIIKSKEVAPPLPRATAVPVEFESPVDQKLKRDEAVKKYVDAGLQDRKYTLDSYEEVKAEEKRLKDEVTSKLDKEKKEILSAGETRSTKETSGILPMFRPSRISNVPSFSRPLDEAGANSVYLDPPTQLSLSPDPTYKRMYRDPKTGELREPTPGEELTEAFARQPVFTEKQARQRDEQRRQAQLSIEARRKAGEDIPFYEGAGTTALEGLESLMAQPEEYGRGIIETRLGASVRALPAVVSALSAEGYFRGLGYEVDEQGRPVDPTDLAIEIEKLRTKLGLPETGSIADMLRIADKDAVGSVLVSDKMLDPKQSPILNAPIPLPGFKTRREVQSPNELDPEGRRTALSGREEDKDGGTRRAVAKSIATGRSWGDEFMSVPALQKEYADLYGTPNAAFWAGSVGELFIPAGPGVLFTTGGKLGKAAAGSKTAARVAGGVIKAAEAGTATRILESVVPLAKLTPSAGRAAQAAAEAAADIAAITTKGAASEGRVVRSIAKRVIDLDPSLNPAQKELAKAAIKGSHNTPKEIAQAIANVEDAPVLGRRVVDGEEVVDETLLQASRRLRSSIASRVPDDLVAVSETVYVPRAVKKEALSVLNRATKEFLGLSEEEKLARMEFGFLGSTGGRPWSQLSTIEKQGVIEGVRRSAARNSLPEQWRSAREVTELQTYLGGDFLKSYRDSVTARKAMAVLGPKARLQQLETAAVRNTTRALEGAGPEAAKQLSTRLTAEAKNLGSVPKALDKIAGEELKGDSVQHWKQLLGSLYGGERVEVLVKDIELASKARNIDSPFISTPTVSALEAVDRQLVDAGLASKGRPDFNKAMLKLIVDEGIRKNLAKRGVEYEAFFGAGGLDRSLLGSVRRPESAKVAEFQTPGGGTATRVYDIGESTAELKLSEGGQEFVRVIQGIDVPGRLGVASLVEDLSSSMARAAKNSLRGMKYGYVLPNLPFLTGRLMSVPIISLATIGAENTLRAAGRQLNKTQAWMRRTGVGLDTPSGVHYSPEDLEALVGQYGIGQTAVAQERLSSLADDLLRSATEASRGNAGKTAELLNPAPWKKSFWMRTAEAVENSYRRSVFEMALAGGSTPLEASLLARKSLFDYNAVPDTVKVSMGRYLASSSQTFSGLAELLETAIENPKYITRLVKAQSLRARAQDPYGLEGDKGLKTLGIITVGRPGEESLIYGPENPLMAPVEDTLSLLHAANFLVGKSFDLYDASKNMTPSGLVDAGFSGGRQVIVDAVEDSANQVLDAYEAFDQRISDDEEAGKIVPGGVSDTRTFWAALLAADMAQANGYDGVWEETLRILDPVVVRPPKEFADPTSADHWIAQPPAGTPYISDGFNKTTNQPLYLVFKPSQRGLANLKIIRSLTPEAFERAFGAGVALTGASIQSDKVNAEAVLPTGAKGAAAVLFGEPAGPADELYRKTKQSERIAAQQ